MTRFDLKSYLERRRPLVNNALHRIVGTGHPEDARLQAAMAHSLNAGGKRLRPILCIAGAEAVGASGEMVIEAACALEMIHTYSLIHDDLPAMDDDALRRGKPTCHMAFDEATAILAGDALLTAAFEILAAAALDNPIPPLLWLQVIHRIAAAAGRNGMVEGQMQDILAEGRTVPLDALRSLHLKKTGALIRASVCTGAILAGAERWQTDALDLYGENIGLAFQVIDDILNVEGDPTRMGKSVGTDAIRDKSTYPALMGLEPSRDYARNLVGNALNALERFDNRSDPLRALARYVIERKR